MNGWHRYVWTIMGLPWSWCEIFYSCSSKGSDWCLNWMHPTWKTKSFRQRIIVIFPKRLFNQERKKTFELFFFLVLVVSLPLSNRNQKINNISNCNDAWKKRKQLSKSLLLIEIFHARTHSHTKSQSHAQKAFVKISKLQITLTLFIIQNVIAKFYNTKYAIER